MEIAINLAKKGRGKVSPNQLVGCVLVKNNEIIGEGWHNDFGGPHAEVQAIAKSIDLTTIEKMVQIIATVKQQKGRLFFIGVGGSLRSGEIELTRIIQEIQLSNQDIESRDILAAFNEQGVHK